MKGMIIFINSSLKRKKWFDISIVAARLDSNHPTVDWQSHRIIKQCLSKYFETKKPALGAGFVKQDEKWSTWQDNSRTGLSPT
jgi:hypothetical protein